MVASNAVGPASPSEVFYNMKQPVVLDVPASAKVRKMAMTIVSRFDDKDRIIVDEVCTSEEQSVPFTY